MEQPPYPYGLQPNDAHYILSDMGNALHGLSGVLMDGMRDWVQAADAMLRDLEVVAKAVKPPDWVTLLVLSVLGLMCFALGALVVGLGCLRLKGCRSAAQKDLEAGPPSLEPGGTVKTQG